MIIPTFTREDGRQLAPAYVAYRVVRYISEYKSGVLPGYVPYTNDNRLSRELEWGYQWDIICAEQIKRPPPAVGSRDITMMSQTVDTERETYGIVA